MTQTFKTESHYLPEVDSSLPENDIGSMLGFIIFTCLALYLLLLVLK